VLGWILPGTELDLAWNQAGGIGLELTFDWVGSYLELWKWLDLTSDWAGSYLGLG
jgi:hypothetical protein